MPKFTNTGTVTVGLVLYCLYLLACFAMPALVVLALIKYLT